MERFLTLFVNKMNRSSIIAKDLNQHREKVEYSNI